jgi:hypothetical protein
LPIIPPLFSYLVYTVKDMKQDVKDIKDSVVDGAVEFVEEEKAASGGVKAFVAGGVGGMSAVLVGQSGSPFLPSHSACLGGRLAGARRALCSSLRFVIPVLRLLPPGHPFDLTKTRMQTATPGAYTGAIDVVKKTLARDGIRG